MYILQSSSQAYLLYPGLGIRPGPAGRTIVSSGLADLDLILGGGLPLGSLILVLEDGVTSHHLTLLQYFIAEGLNNEQKVLWAGSQRSAAFSKLPQLANQPKRTQVALHRSLG